MDRSDNAPTQMGVLITDLEIQIISKSVESGHDVQAVLDWARETRASADVLTLVLQGRIRITVQDGEPRFLLAPGAAASAAAEQLLVEGGLAVTVEDGDGQ